MVIGQFINFVSLTFMTVMAANKTEMDQLLADITLRIVRPDMYNKWVRPNAKGDAVQVGLSMYIVSIDEIDLFNMDVTLDFYLRQHWLDDRLAFDSYGYNKTLQPGHEFVGKIWRPDMFFVEERRADELNSHEYHRHDTFIRIEPNGYITLSKRYSVTLRCPMDITIYPFDVQVCKMTLESYGHRSLDIRWFMFTADNSSSSVVFDTKGGLLSEYEVIPGYSYSTEKTLSTGTYSRMVVPFGMVRLVGNHAIHVYVPCTLIVVISWIPFWTDRHARVERLALGVTTVLTMTTLQAETNSQLPRVSYIRSIDIYIGTCFLLVFAALIECTIFGYLDRRYGSHTVQRVDQLLNNGNYEYCKNKRNGSTVETNNELLLHDEEKRKLMQGYFHCGDARQLPARSIRYSRVLYPLLFTIFNAYYWVSILSARLNKIDEFHIQPDSN